MALVWFSASMRSCSLLVDRAASERLDVHAWQLAWTLMKFFDLAGDRRDAARVPSGSRRSRAAS